MKDTLAEIQERHEAVKELERSLLDLHNIFLDMAVLVEEQGEKLDNIQNQVSVHLIGQPLSAVSSSRLYSMFLIILAVSCVLQRA